MDQPSRRYMAAYRWWVLMSEKNHRNRMPYFIGPAGGRATLDNLPPRTLRRWLPHHKAIVLSAVQQGILSFGEACERYNLTLDEYLSWQRSLQRQTMPSL